MKSALIALLLALPLAALHSADAVDTKATKPNIVFLLADDLRWDALEMRNLATDPAHQDRLRQLRQQHQEFTITLR